MQLEGWQHHPVVVRICRYDNSPAISIKAHASFCFHRSQPDVSGVLTMQEVETYLYLAVVPCCKVSEKSGDSLQESDY